MKKYNICTTNEIKPSGWLKKQLEIQAEGLNGNLDKVWRDVRDSAWIGGEAEGWERVPYWLDGFIPLAYLLDNDDMKARAKKYIDAIIAAQRPNGWICPCDDDYIPRYDTWAVQLISKVLVVYYECSGDERVPGVVYKILKNYYELLKAEKIKLFEWGKFRWYECFIAINFVYERTGEEWLTELAKILKKQGTDFHDTEDKWLRPLNKWTLETHIVNLAMMLKSEAVSCDILGDKYEDFADHFKLILKEYNGTPVGLFTGDECLSGISPIQGTELCAVAEQMYSYELLYAYTGDKKWVEELERLAFNALPATISDDMWTHQYDQMSNQIACQKFPGKSIFGTNNGEAHLFGLEPNFGCCTANFGQAWPKFALSAFMYDDNSVISAVAVPSEFKTDKISIRLDTNYPFENSFKYSIESQRDFVFKVRIPSFAQNVKASAETVKDGEMLCFEIKSGDKTEIELSFETTPHFADSPCGLKTVECGSLVFSLPIKYKKVMYEYERDNVERKYPYCDYEYVPESEWAFAYSSESLKVNHSQVGEIPFSSENPPITVTARVRPIDWGFERGYETVCARLPQSLDPTGDEVSVELYPYGCAKLRMTEMPMI